MTNLLEKLGTRQRAGSKPRCHWLTHGSPEQVAERLTKLIAPWGSVTSDDRWMPEGFADTEEAQLHKAPRLLNPGIGQQLQGWWLAVPSQVADKDAIVIVETNRRDPGLHNVDAALQRWQPNHLLQRDRFRRQNAEGPDM